MQSERSCPVSLTNPKTFSNTRGGATFTAQTPKERGKKQTKRGKRKKSTSDNLQKYAKIVAHYNRKNEDELDGRRGHKKKHMTKRRRKKKGAKRAKRRTSKTDTGISGGAKNSEARKNQQQQRKGKEWERSPNSAQKKVMAKQGMYTMERMGERP